MSKPGWKTCRCGRRTRHAHGICTVCLKSKDLLAEPPVRKAQVAVDPLPGGCERPTYVRPERRKECPRCGKTRDNLPEAWVLRTVEGPKKMDICEWCFEELWLRAEHNEDGYIVHGGCPCPTCTMHREKMLEVSHEMKRLKSGTSAP